MSEPECEGVSEAASERHDDSRLDAASGDAGSSAVEDGRDDYSEEAMRELGARWMAARMAQGGASAGEGEESEDEEHDGEEEYDSD